MADAACLDCTVPSPPTMFVVDMPWCNYAMNMARMIMNIINSSSTIQIAPPSQHTFSHATLGTHLSRALKNARIRPSCKISHRHYVTEYYMLHVIHLSTPVFRKVKKLVGLSTLPSPVNNVSLMKVVNR